MPNSLCNKVQNVGMNLGSRSDTISLGTPCSLIIWSPYNLIKVVKGNVFLIRMKWIDFVNQSTITDTISSGGRVDSRLVTKPKVI